MGTQSSHFVPYCSEKWNAERLRSGGNASNRTVPFQTMERLKLCYESRTMCNRTGPFPSEQANGIHVNGTMAFPSEHKATLVRDRLFPSEQPICPFQKFERRWNGTIVFPCELG